MVADKVLGNFGGASGVGGISPVGPAPTNKPETSGTQGSTFGNVLDSKLGQAPLPKVGEQGVNKTEGLRFSQHALERMNSRGISFKPEEMTKLNEAIDKAALKGAKQSLVLMGDNALIVSVKNKTVVTAMDRDAMKENVFTNIDSTMIL